MKYLKLLVLFLPLSSFISCANSDQKRADTGMGNQKEAFKTQDADTLISYYPEKPTVTKLDTIIDKDANVRVVIIQEPLETNVTQFYTRENGMVERYNYRDYSTSIQLYRQDSIIFRQSFSKHDFPEIRDPEFLTQATTHRTWIKEYDSKSQTVKFTHIIGVPDTDWSYDFTLSVDSMGNLNKLLEEVY